jgi:hypothetical protein
MKNLYVIPTDKPSRLSILNSGKLNFGAEIMSSSNSKPQNIYITSNEEIKEGDWLFDLDIKRIVKADSLKVDTSKARGCWYYKKIILTTDQDLIKDGVQAINDEFLEWFVKNPSCEIVEIVKIDTFKKTNEVYVDEITGGNYYEIIKHNKIIIPRVEPKQKTLEETAFWLFPRLINDPYNPTEDDNKENRDIWISGAKWQAGKMYSDAECYRFLHDLMTDIKLQGLIIRDDIDLKKWFEQHKKK